MLQDTGADGDAQRIIELCWMFFLKIIDDQDQDRAAAGRLTLERSPTVGNGAPLGLGSGGASPAKTC